MPVKSTPDAARVRRFRRALLRWFRRRGRDLPWRCTRDPWSILVSEFMLQQTQVPRVTKYYDRFLTRFPTAAHAARAPAAAVREAWDGLGYYRRAADLHRLAVAVEDRHRSVIPDDVERLRALPGVGEYTAGAVACFAFEQAVPAIDTNVERVLRRAFHPRLGRGAAASRRLRASAQRLLPRNGPTAWAMNQGLMELGALVCTARVAHCPRCPVRNQCRTGAAR